MFFNSVTIVSILRLQSLIFFANSKNPTWDQWIVGWWSTIEVNVGMICTCLPTVRLILVRAWPRVFSTNSSRNKSVSGFAERYGRHSNLFGRNQIELSSVETNLAETTGKKSGVVSESAAATQ